MVHILLMYTGISILYSTMALVGSSMFSLLPIVIIELAGESSLAPVTGVVNVYQALAFFASAPIASKYLSFMNKCGMLNQL